MSRDDVHAILFGLALSFVAGGLLGLIIGLAGCSPAPATTDCPVMPGPGPIYDATAQRWMDADLGDLPDLEHLRTETREVPADGFSGCDYPDVGLLTGCSWWDDDAKVYRVEVLECRHDTAETLAHEYTHALIWVSTGGQTADPAHEHEAWGLVAAPRVEGGE